MEAKQVVDFSDAHYIKEIIRYSIREQEKH
jgi:hypothetical protein